MSFRKNSIYLFFFILFFFVEANSYESKKQNKQLIIEHLSGIKEFSSSFIQSNNVTTESGEIFIKNKRIRVDYNDPTRITLVLSENKAMYYHEELEEVEYFNPKKTIARVFFDIFYEKTFLEDCIILFEKNSIVIKKEVIFEENESYELNIYFETKPTLLRKIEIFNQGEKNTYSIFDHNFYPKIDSSFFSMANPLLN